MCRLVKSRMKWVGHVERMDEDDMQGSSVSGEGEEEDCA